MNALLNSDVIYSYGLIWLESTFLLTSLLILHWLKRIIGSAPLYLTLGIIIVFAHLMASAGIRFISTELGLDMGVSTSAIMLPCLALMLVIYIVDGTLAAQRIIIATMAGLGMFLYLRSVGILECSWPGYSISQGVLADFLAKLLRDTTKHMGASTIAITFDMFLLPIIFQRLHNKGCRPFLCTASALILGQIFHSFVFLSVYHWGNPRSLLLLLPQILPQILIAIWISMITTVYLFRIRHEIPGGVRSSLEIVFAFFGAYGQAKLLEQNLRESEQRCRTIIQNAGDLIFVTDANGSIADANKSALRAFNIPTISDAIGANLQDLAGISLVDEANESGGNLDDHVIRVRLTGPPPLDFELHLSRISIAGTPAYVFVGRDITEELKLSKEREDWRAEYSHRQRLEAIGRLAGGIAHDFNNHLHAIQGHLDLIYMEGASDENMKHLEKIDAIAQQAAKLTGQLLGYARKGRRQIRTLELNGLVRNAMELFLPDSRSGLAIVTRLSEEKIRVAGDETQLHQAVLNLMINAKDAMAGLPPQNRILTIAAGTLPFLDTVPVPPPELRNKDFGTLCGIRVSDTGPGVPPEIIEKIFEPFFTTKPTGQGTGMGLSMSYGVALEHGGWVQYDSKGEGAAFTLILPEAEDSSPV